MSLSDILDKHFNKGQSRALKRLLLEFELYRPLSDISEGIYGYKPGSDREEAIRHFGEQSAAFVSLVSLWLIQQEGNKNAVKNRDAVGCLLVSMAIEALQHYRLKPDEAYSLVHKLVMADVYLVAFHMETFLNFIGKVYEKWLAIPRLAITTDDNYPPCSEIYFIWQILATDADRHISQELFIKDLYHHWHRKICLKSLRMLFDGSGKPFIIEVPSKYLLEFLAVFYLMHQCKRIICKNSKGIFVFMKSHLQPPEGDSYPCWQDFSQMFHKELNHTVRGKILCKKAKPLVDKYGISGVSE